MSFFMNFLLTSIRFNLILQDSKKGPKKAKKGVFLRGSKRPFFVSFLGLGIPGSGGAPKYKQRIPPARKLTYPRALDNKDPKK